MATPTSSEAFAYLVEALKNKENLISDIYATTGIDKMYRDCRNISNKMDELRRCGCRECRDEFYRLEDRRYRERDYKPLSVYDSIPQYMIAQKEIKMTETKPVEEPKNIAVKHLVDKLKAEQSVLTSHKITIDSHKKIIAQYNGLLKNTNVQKLASEKNIRELSVALKKLGHKE